MGHHEAEINDQAGNVRLGGGKLSPEMHENLDDGSLNINVELLKVIGSLLHYSI